MASVSINFEHDDDGAVYHLEITADVRPAVQPYCVAGDWIPGDGPEIEIRTVLVNKIQHFYGSRSFERIPCADEAAMISAWLKADVLPGYAEQIEAKLAAAV